MVDAMRAQLDALMGINRDGDKEDELARKYYESNVCRYHLCGLCPHELFTNTKIDMGSCGKQHSKRLQEEYEEAKTHGKDNYDRELLEYLDKLIVECDRKIQRASKRLEEDDADAKTYPPISKVIRTDETDAISVLLKEKADRLSDDTKPLLENDREELKEEIRQLEDDRALKQANALLSQFKETKGSSTGLEQVAAAEPELDEESKVLIAAKMAEAEALGEEGEVDEAQRKLEEVEAIKRMASIRAAPSRAVLERERDQKLRVCDICGAFLSIYDSDRRLADHFGGKMHLGYQHIRDKIKQVTNDLFKKPSAGGGGGERRERERSRERGVDRARERDAYDRRDRDHHRSGGSGGGGGGYGDDRRRDGYGGGGGYGDDRRGGGGYGDDRRRY